MRNEYRAAQAPAGYVVPVTAGRQAGLVVEEVVSVELFVPVRPPAAAVELLGAALGHNGNGASGIAAELGLIVRSQNLDFADGVDVRFEMRKATAATGVHVDDPVHRETRDARAAVEGKAAQDASPGRIPSRRGVNHARKQPHVAHHVAAFD